ncbi:MAG: glycine--tRNA ligase [Nanoarchaeota archaeon]
MMDTKRELSIEELTNFCKRKGFVFRSSDIYGGLAGFWDFGPLGAELFNNIKQNFWKFFVQKRKDIIGIEASIISHPRTWKASGHLANFKDIAVVCKKCKKAAKIDKSDLGKIKCECGGEYIKHGEFNLMFSTKAGALNTEEVYLRGENAQAMFMNFKLVQETSRKQLPFGIAQVGKCFRNEIAPRDFLFRSREFTIGELEFFIHPKEIKCELFDNEHKKIKIKLLDADAQIRGKEVLKEINVGQMVKEKKLDEWHAYWLAEQIIWLRSFGLGNKIKVREHKKDELSHYSSATFDIDYEYPFGSKEIAGNANRGQYDLMQHIKESGEKLDVFDEKSKERVIPKVIEPTFGMERVFLAVLCQAYSYDKKRENVVLELPAFLAPVKAAIFPIVKDEKMIKIAEKIYDELREEWNVSYDESGSVGKRYSRNDEVGTPMCITIDEQSLKDKSVTIRDRDTTKQVRIKIDEIEEVLRRVIKGESLLKLGKIVETRVK